jgi:hypothetical protein
MSNAEVADNATAAVVVLESPDAVTNNFDVLNGATQVEVVSGVLDWGADIDPENMLICIHKLKNLPTDLTGSNKKPLPTSYKEWAKMTSLQKNKTMDFYKGCTKPGQISLATHARSMTSDIVQSDAMRNEKVNKNDIVRLFHLRKDPENQNLWEKTMHVMTRRELDARNADTASVNGGTMSDENNPWIALADRFNDHTGYVYQNYLLAHVYDEKTKSSIAVVPYKSANQDTEVLFSKCRDLDPTDPKRKLVPRDGAWLKEQWTSWRGKLSAIFSDFNRSGQQSQAGEAEIVWMSLEEQKRWVYHTANKHRTHDQCSTYTFGMFDKSDFENNLGKDLTVDASIDSSLSSSGQKRRKRKNNSAAKSKSKRPHEVEEVDLAKVIDQAFKDTAKRERLGLMLQHGSLQDKEDALVELRNMVKADCVQPTVQSTVESTSAPADKTAESTAIAGSEDEGSSDEDSETSS